MARVSALLKSSRNLESHWSDETNRYIDHALRFREVNRIGDVIAPTGRLSRIYGWRFDRWKLAPDGTLGDYVDSDELDIEPHVLDANPSQFDILCDDETRHFLIFGSRGASKSALLVRFLAKLGAKKPRGRSATVLPKRKKARELVEEMLLPLLPGTWLRHINRSPDELAVYLANRHHFDFLSAKVRDDARASTLVGGAIDETQLVDDETRTNLLLSCRGAGDFQTLETGTYVDGPVLDYIEKARASSRYRFVELSITDNVHLDVSYDPVTDCRIPEVVISARETTDARRFEQEVGVWDAEARKFRPRPYKPTSAVYWPFERHVHVRPYSPESAESIVRKLYSSAVPRIGKDITQEVMLRRFGSSVPYAVGMNFSQPELTGVVAKIFSTPPGVPDLLWILDEVGRAEEVNASVIAQELRRRGYFPAGVIPDAAGRHSDGGRTAIEMVRAEGFTTRGPNKNPPEMELIDKVNAKLRNAANHVTLLVDPRCKRLVAGLAGQRRSEGSGRPEVMSNNEQCYLYALGFVTGYLVPIRELSYRDLDDEEALG